MLTAADETNGTERASSVAVAAAAAGASSAVDEAGATPAGGVRPRVFASSA